MEVMTEIIEADPFSIVTSEFNERTEVVEETDDGPTLEESVAEIGVVEPPKVREIDSDEYDYEVIVGQRRVLAAQAVGLETVPVIVGEWDDLEALSMSITENIEGFKQRVSTSDRSRALATVWELMGGEGFPSSTDLSQKLGIPRPTIDTWLEPLRPEWEGTRIQDEVDVENQQVSSEEETDENKETEFSERIIDLLSEPTLSEIRRATGGGEEGQTVAERVLEEDLVLSQVRDLRKHLEGGDDLDTAVEKVTQEEEELPQSFADFKSDDTEEEVEEVDDPTEVEETTEDFISDQIESLNLTDVEVEGEISFTLTLPEKAIERAEAYGSDFGYETVDELLLIETLPDFLESDEGRDLITEIIQEKAKARGH